MVHWMWTWPSSRQIWSLTLVSTSLSPPTLPSSLRKKRITSSLLLLRLPTPALNPRTSWWVSVHDHESWLLQEYWSFAPKSVFAECDSSGWGYYSFNHNPLPFRSNVTPDTASTWLAVCCTVGMLCPKMLMRRLQQSRPRGLSSLLTGVLLDSRLVVQHFVPPPLAHSWKLFE